jgi:hypothetical protein
VTEGEFSMHMLAQLDQWASCVTGAIDADRYVSMLHDVGFEPVEIVDKVSAEEVIEVKQGMPRLFSARIVAYKPA